MLSAAVMKTRLTGGKRYITDNLIQRPVTALPKICFANLIMVSCRLAGFMDQLQKIS